ncbi:Six-hairpin glycosidase [Auriculariales sp. MPI-PUGE-AT-0066]|nr:Six-hairpin glycosidase [Auriculariales sp. MPI-PUGE-AT-0066]
MVASGTCVLLALVLPLALSLPSHAKPQSQVARASTDWTSYVLGPKSRTVLPMAILAQNGVQNADALIGKADGAARLSSGSSQFRWPDGTTASASSTQSPNNGNGSPRTYDAKNAIDGSSATFFSDATEDDAAGDDWLLINSPSAISAPGVTILSSPDGAIEDFVVETSSDGSTFAVAKTVTGNKSLAPYVAFDAPVSFTALRITVSKNGNTGKRVYTRIAEVIPSSEWAGDLAWPANTKATASSEHAPATEGSYAASNAVDGNPQTFWNDDTENQQPDVLTVTVGDTVVLPGITVVSNSDGAPVDFTVETTLDNQNWNVAATIKDNNDVTIPVQFAEPTALVGFRITVTRVQDKSKGVFTRVAEVLPRLAAAAPYVDLDFGRVVVGHIVLKFAAASDPAPQLRLSFSETKQYFGFTSDYSPSDYSGGSKTDDVVPPVAGGEWRDEKQCQFNDKVCADGLRGFRYLRIYVQQTPGAESNSAAQGWAEIAAGGVSLDFTGYLGTQDTYKGHFISSDDLLNKIWYAAAYTVELDTDTFTKDTVDPRNAYSDSLDGKIVQHDGAKRDRDPYIGDVAVSSLVDLVSHADTQGARNVIIDLAQHQRDDGWIPPASISNYGLNLFDYSAWWAIAASDLVLWAADTELANAIWEPLKKLMDTHYPSVSNSVGLLDKSGSFQGYGDYAFLPRNGVVTYYTGNYIRALRGAAVVASFLNHPDEANSWTSRAQSVSAALAASDNFDETAGAWRDASPGAGNPTANCHSQDATAFAILSNSSTPDRSQRSLDFLSKTNGRTWGNSFIDQDCFGGGTSDRVYLFTSHPEVMARFTVNDDAGALELIRRGWGYQVVRDPVGTFWEGVGRDGDVGNYEGAFTSMAHGWSAGAAVALSTKLLGVEPTSPGFATYDVTPHPADVKWANGTVPTPRGAISAAWYYDASNKLQVDVNGPEGTTANVRLPVTAGAKRDGVFLQERSTAAAGVTLNGRVVWRADGSVKVKRSGFSSISFDGDYVYVRGLAGGRRHVVGVTA